MWGQHQSPTLRESEPSPSRRWGAQWDHSHWRAGGGTESQQWGGGAGRGRATLGTMPLAPSTDPHTSLSTHFFLPHNCLQAAATASPGPTPEPSGIQGPAQLSFKVEVTQKY